MEKRREEEEAASYARIRKLEEEIIAEENRIRAGEMKKVTGERRVTRVREQEMKKVDILNAEADSFKAQQERIEANSRDAVARGEACVSRRLE